MARNASQRRWIKAAVIAFGVADCMGIYYAQQRLNQPVPDAIRYDRAAIMAPEDNAMFHAGPAPQLAMTDTRAVPQIAPSATAPRAAVAKPVAQPVLAAAAPQPSVAPAKAAPVVTPHLARVDAPAPNIHAASAKVLRAALTSQANTVAIALAAPAAKAPAAKTASSLTKTVKAPLRQTLAKASPDRASSHAKPSSLVHLVPQPRQSSEFASAFASFDAPIQPTQQLELALPSVEQDRVAQPDFAVSSPALETPIPAAPVELPPVSASADTPEAKL